jgi:RNA polymerase subunit RPABC4/transcription elongation factor Spt4
MQLRTANPILPYFAASLVIIFTPAFFPFAIVAYRVVRPQEKIGEVYERTLAEEALLAEVEAVKSCPTCARRVDEEWIICPTCRTRLNRVCPNCSRLVGLDWSLCAWCGRDFERAVPGFEAIPTPRQAPMPAVDPPFMARPAAAVALDPPSYRTPAPMASSGLREVGARDGGSAGTTPARQTAPQAIGGSSSALTTGYEPPAGATRSLDRAPLPPTATQIGTSASAHSSRPTAQRGPVKQAKGPRPATDPLPER